jgi:GNAT superfamily N-acetyltransferase
MPPLVSVRLATAADAAVIARHRAEMFRDMGRLPDALYDSLVDATTRYMEDAIPSGEYLGWLASPLDTATTIAAGAGIQRRRAPPRPRTHPSGTVLAYGNQAIVLNVFTERAWRRRGIGRLLMEHVLGWARDAQIDSLVLHASNDGRRLYESLGFVQTNEMRYEGDLRNLE